MPFKPNNIPLGGHAPSRPATMKWRARVYTSDATQRLVPSETSFAYRPGAEDGICRVYPNHPLHEVIGYGGAATQSAACVWARLPKAKREEFMQRIFSADGAAYNLCRIPLMSCDFSERPYEYELDRRDASLSRFKLAEADERQIIPFLQSALRVNPQLEVIASPWSPPGFMKSTRLRNFGGHLKLRYRQRWAKVMALSVASYRQRGIPVTRLTVQNEPKARQTWESCLYTATEEIEFAVEFLRRELDELGLQDVKILLWDHNKDGIVERADAYDAWLASRGLALPGEGGAVSGYAFHWYTGSHFEAVSALSRAHPAAEMVLSEICTAYTSDSSNSVVTAEHHLRELMGDFNAGAQAYLEWNLLLDSQGGPNHAGNFCNSSSMATDDFRDVVFGLERSYIDHVSRFVPCGSRVVLSSRCSNGVELLAATRDDGYRVAVAMNCGPAPYKLRLADGNHLAVIEMPAHSAATCIW